MNALDVGGNRPGKDGLDLIRVHVEAVSSDEIAEEFHLNLMERALGSLGVETVLAQQVKDLLDVRFVVFSVLTVNKYVVHVGEGEVI